jgi:hypothetical protein
VYTANELKILSHSAILLKHGKTSQTRSEGERFQLSFEQICGISMQAEKEGGIGAFWLGNYDIFVA